MTETTEYHPAADVPALDQLQEDMKKAAKEHPDYGTCPHCIKAVRVDRFGRLRDHPTPELASGAIKATYHCPGSTARYAEYGEFGKTWDLATGQWVEMPVDVPVLFVHHDRAAERGWEFPLWQLFATPADEDGLVRRAAQKLLDGSKWRIDLLINGLAATGYLVRLDQEQPTVSSMEVDETEFGGIDRMMLKLTEQIEAFDLADEAASA